MASVFEGLWRSLWEAVNAGEVVGGKVREQRWAWLSSKIGMLRFVLYSINAEQRKSRRKEESKGPSFSLKLTGYNQVIWPVGHNGTVIGPGNRPDHLTDLQRREFRAPRTKRGIKQAASPACFYTEWRTTNLSSVRLSLIFGSSYKFDFPETLP